MSNVFILLELLLLDISLAMLVTVYETILDYYHQKRCQEIMAFYKSYARAYERVLRYRESFPERTRMNPVIFRLFGGTDDSEF